MTEISSTISSTSTTAQRRKIKKPLIEKRRRLRINQCLASLKSLVLEATNKDENCFPKMEKADILEMTVSYMRTVRHCAPISTSGPPDSSEQVRTYLSGYRECAMEVCRFFQDDSTLPVGVPEVRAQLTRHLSGCFQRIQSAVDRPGQFSMTGMEAVNCKKRCEEDRLPSPSSSCSSGHSSSSSPVPFSSPVPLPSSSNPVADAPRNLVSISSSGTSVSFAFSSSRPRGAEPSRDSNPLQSLPATAVFSSTLQPSSRSKLPKQTPRLAHHLRQSSLLSQQQQQQPSLPFSQCLSPKRADEFPTAVVTTAARHSPDLQAATPRNQSTIGSRTVAFFEPLPASEDHCSMVWRPW